VRARAHKDVLQIGIAVNVLCGQFEMERLKLVKMMHVHAPIHYACLF
jgi:hypothetical protein